MALGGMSILVTGAGGFLGMRIVQMLMEEDLATIHLMDKEISADLMKMCNDHQNKTLMKLHQGDIRDEEFLQRTCQGVDLVIHSAAIIDFMGNISKDMLMAINVMGTQNLLEACVLNNVQYFIYTSSVEVLGPNTRGDPVIDGNENLVYESKLSFSYGKSKSQAEQSVLKANGRELKSGGAFITCSLRPMYIYGEGSQFLQMHLDQAILNGGVFHRMSRKEALVNPVYVGNIAWAHITAARAMIDPEKAKKIAGNFYYVSDDTPYISYSDFNHSLGKELGLGVEARLPLPFSVLYYVAFLMEALSYLLKPIVSFVPPFTRHLLLLLNTPFTFSYKKAQRDLDYKPRYGWEEAKQRTTAWMASALPLCKERLKKNKRH